MIAQLLGFAEFLLKSKSQISGQAVYEIKMIAMDGKFDEESLQESLPGMFFLQSIYNPQFNSHVICLTFLRSG